MSTTTDNPYKNLRKWNAVMAVLHFVQGVFMFFLSNENLTQISLWLPKPIPASRSADLVMQDWYSVNLGYTISLFLFASAIAHLITITPGIYEWYIAKLKDKINLIRWFEYAISSSIMIFVIAILCGVRDGFTLLLLVGLNACMNLFGASMELYNSLLRKSQPESEKGIFKPEWSNFIYGCFAGILPWVVMSAYFFVSLNRLGDLEELPQRVKDVLNTVKFIFPTLFVFFNLFAINMVLQYKQIGKWKDYLFGEKAYIILSLTAKSFLAWFIWGGTLR
jgi:hypothetical protein